MEPFSRGTARATHPALTIRKNKKPVLETCDMTCDNGLHKKLEKYELTRFMNKHSTNLLIGRPGSGKTSLLYSLFKSKQCLRKCYHSIYLFQPSHSRVSMKDPIFDTLPDDQKFEELNYESLANVVNRIKSADKKENNCIIMDDMTAYLKNGDTLQLLKELIFNRRHYHTSIFFLVQTWFSVPKDIRKLFSNIFVFKVNKNELENIFEESVEQKKDLAMDIAKVVFREPYQYLFINTDSQRLFRGFDEIVLPDADITL